MAAKYGKTWWGEQWLNSLNNIDYENRLGRGKTYANKGAVISIDFEENRISATVTGSRPKPYSVNVILPPFFDPELSNFIDLLIEKPTTISKLLNRELAPEVQQIAEEAGLKVFPKQWTDFKMQCSCPDWAVPCKHLAAVIYKITAEIDNNPFLVFDLRRVDLISELEKKGVFITSKTTKFPTLFQEYVKESAIQNEVPFTPNNAYQKIDFSILSDIQEPLVSLLNNFPVFYQGNGDFKEKYAAKIRKIKKIAQNVLKGKTALETLYGNDFNDIFEITRRSTEQIFYTNELEHYVLVDDQKISVPHFFTELLRINSQHTIDYQPSTAALHTVHMAAIHLIANGAIVPQIIIHNQESYSIRWVPAIISKEVCELMKKLETIIPPDFFYWVKEKESVLINQKTGFNLLSLILTNIITYQSPTPDKDLFINFFFRNECYDFDKPGEESLSGGIQNWLQKYYLTQGKYKPQIIVNECGDETFSLDINVIDSSENTISLEEVLKNNEHSKIRYEILKSLTQISSFITGLDDYINSDGISKIELSSEEFTPFLTQMIPVIKLLDIPILLPKSLQQILKPKISVKIKRKNESHTSFLRLDKMLDFDWQIAIGDNLISQEEFEQLMKKSDGLIKYKTNYIYVNEQELEKLHRHFSYDQTMSSTELLRTTLTEEYQGSEISISDEIKKIIAELTEVKSIKLPKKLKATLRPYQARGFSWLYKNAQIGFGSVLADDMGLGKTLQVITFIQKLKEEKQLNEEKVVVISPTGLMTNWEAEFEKFAPDIKVKLYHGTKRKLNNDDDYDVLITSYGIIRSDHNKLNKTSWHTVVIDEAQNIKNTNTGQTKAVKAIKANNYIAMSGTPVENRLSELWSIFDYSNRGFLGTLKKFGEEYGTPIEKYNDAMVAEKLKQVTAPFLLRRLKSDKSIISDLPDKIEIDAYAHLERQQASLYKQTLKEAMETIEREDGTDKKALFIRQGLVLQMILALKQICNHPTQFLKNNIFDSKLSGKMNLLFEKLDTIVDNNEKVLIFTQFTKMGELLKRFISERYNQKPLFYHGGVTVKARKKMVDDFQTNRAENIFILTIKSAGTGLNLTAANHVIHYDLWWNPAVEAQATDRAYRIGQKNNVFVHRFITKNTFEEKINEMIQHKKELANLTVSTGENWIGNLSNKELNELFKI